MTPATSQVSPPVRALLWCAPLALALFSLAALPQTPFLRELALSARSGYLLPMALTLLCAALLAQRRAAALSLPVLALLFYLPLVGIWSTGISNVSYLGGLIPCVDAWGYFEDVKRLLSGEYFSTFATRRPLFPSFFATLFWLARYDLKLALIATDLVTTACIFFAVDAIRRYLGRISSAFALLLLFLFYRRFIGTVLTENLGLALGALSLALTLRGVFQREVRHFLAGLFLLTVGLIARAGFFFVLPMLLVWGSCHFYASPSRRFRFLLGGVGVIASGFLVNWVLLKVVGSPEGGAFSNFAYVLYGLIHGGNWTLALTNPVPELAGLQGLAFSDKLYQLSFRAIAENPWLLVKGVLRAWKTYLSGYEFCYIRPIDLDFRLHPLFTLSFRGKLAFLAQSRILLSFLSLLAVTYGLSLYSFFTLWRRRPKEMSLLWALLAGVLLSVPFAPPWDCDSGRVYAATVPYLLLIPVFGLSTLSRWRSFALPGPEAPRSPHPAPCYALAGLLLLLCFAAPIAFFPSARSAAGPPPSAGAGSVEIWSYPGSYLTFRSAPQFATAVPVVTSTDFLANLSPLGLLKPRAKSELAPHVRPGVVLTSTPLGYVLLPEQRMRQTGRFWLPARKIEGSSLGLWVAVGGE